MESVKVDRQSLGTAIQITAWFIAFLWFIKCNEWVFNQPLVSLGVQPSSWGGLIGVVFAPLIHGSAEHLVSNSLPILLLGSALIYGYPKSRWYVVSIVWILSGIGVWLFARPVFHIGASGLTHGVFFYLLVISILRRDHRSVALMMMAFFMYGSMLLTIFPREAGISFEYHLFGGIAGVICAFLFRNWDPKPLKKIYDWELEEELEHHSEQDLIGDEWMLDHQKEKHNVESMVELPQNSKLPGEQNTLIDKDNSSKH